MPDEELLRAAAARELTSPEQAAQAARRMLNDPRARLAMEDFLAQWMRFDRVLETIRYRRLFLEFNSELAAAMTEETKRLFSHRVFYEDFRKSRFRFRELILSLAGSEAFLENPDAEGLVSHTGSGRPSIHKDPIR